VADEINLQFRQSEPAPGAMAAWRAGPPEPLRGFDLVDEAYDALTYERRYQDAVARTMNIVSFGLKWMTGGKTENIWRLTVRFDPDGDYASRVTIVGEAAEDTRAALGRYAAERGEVLRAGGVPAA
jgi:hypothetical protein